LWTAVAGFLVGPEDRGIEILGTVPTKMGRASVCDRTIFVLGAIAAVGQLHRLGKPVPVLLRHPVGIFLRSNLDVAIG
jgi:hypothetical protein